MPANKLKWLILVLLSLVWGTSFILIKKGLVGMTALQVGAARTFIASVFLLLLGSKYLKKIPKEKWKWIVVSALIGTFFPAFLFAYAELEIDSAIVSILNSTVPILALVFGYMFFKASFTRKQILGVSIGLIGSAFLIISGAVFHQNQNYAFAILPLIATSMYALNVHLIKRHLQDVPALSITVGCFTVLIVPSLAVLIFSGLFSVENLSQPEVQTSLFYVAVLAIIGTAIAKALFNRLVQLSSPVFSTSVTYLIPVVAAGWGLLDGEKIGLIQIIGALLILLGVYFSNRKKRVKKPKPAS